MSINRIKQILNSATSKKDVNTDTLLKINLEGTSKLLPPDEMDRILNVSEQFNKERQESPYYRILGSINLNVSNALFNLDDSAYSDLYTWKGFNYQDPSNQIYRFYEGVYPKALKNLDEKNGWFGYYNPSLLTNTISGFNYMEPKPQRFSFIPDNKPFHNSNGIKVKNWEITVTYPYGSDKTHQMVNGGLMIVEAVQATVSTKAMVAFGMPCLHNLSVGDVVRINGTSGYDGDHIVIRLGLDNGDLKDYYFVVDLPPTGIVSGNSRIKKLIGGVESEYYFRIFKKIETRNNGIIDKSDYDIYKLAFSENVYTDKNAQYVFNEDINVEGLKDNLGRPLSQIYITFIKTPSGISPNELFGSVSAGIETPYIPELNNSGILSYLLDIPVINKIHNGGSSPFISHNPLSINVSINDATFYGDLVEYNVNLLNENILAVVSHRFNTLNRESSPSVNYNISLGNAQTNTPPITATTILGPRQEGYFYNPHHLIQIREFSDYIEQGDKFTDGIPDYATNLGDGRIIWRDLTPIGSNQTNESSTNFPFLNGCHYIYNNHCFYVRRQDPFDNWNLFYNQFPADPIGDRMTDKFNFNSSEDVC
jgi:hypothetical protein